MRKRSLLSERSLYDWVFIYMWHWTRWSIFCASCRILWRLRWTVKLFPNCYCTSSWIKRKTRTPHFPPHTPSSSLSLFFPITLYFITFPVCPSLFCFLYLPSLSSHLFCFPYAYPFNIFCFLFPLLLCTRVGTLIVATIYLQLIQNRYTFRSFTVLHCSHQHCLQPVASDVEVVGYL